MKAEATDNSLLLQRGYPKLLSQHLLREFMLPLWGTISAFVMISLLLAVFDDLPDFSGIDISTGKLILYFLARIPDNLMMVFPISALLAVSFMNAVLGKNNELTAIRSAGLSLLHTATKIWLVTLLLCAGIFCLNEFVMPVCSQYVETIQTDYLSKNTKKKAKKETEEGEKMNLTAFYNPLKRQDWFFVDFKMDQPSIGISVCLHDEEGRLTSVITAAEGSYDPNQGYWHFHGVSITDYEYPAGRAANDNTAFLRPIVKPIRFQEELPAPNDTTAKIFNANPRDIAIQSKPIDQMPLRDLLRMRRRNIMLASNYGGLVRTMIAYRIVSPLGTLIAVLFGFALTLTRGRTTAARGFVTAVALFIAYYLICQFFLILGKGGNLHWLIAGILPTISALATALWLTYKRQ